MNTLTLILLAAALAWAAAAEPATRPVQFTVTVGPEGSGAQIKGSDNVALQKAADKLAALAPEGRGLLKILPGTYAMYDSLHVRVPMIIRGAGAETILRKCPQFVTELTREAGADVVDLKVKDASEIKVGYGITLRPPNVKAAWAPVMRTITAVNGDTIRIDRPAASEATYGRPDKPYPAGSVVQSSFPLVAARFVDDVEIEDLVVDGNLTENRDMYVDGCRNGGIYFTGGKDHAVRRCVVRDFAGDGVSWQTTHNVTVEQCESFGHLGYGFHPGTGSRSTVVRDSKARHNGDIGIFVCWNVKHGRFENNTLEHNGNHGITIGHNDTDNLFAGNVIRLNGVSGIRFRNDGPPPSRCTYRGNVIEDNGPPGRGVGIDMPYAVSDVVLEGNTIRDTRPDGQKAQVTAIKASPKVSRLTVAEDNQIEGAVELPATQPAR